MKYGEAVRALVDAGIPYQKAYQLDRRMVGINKGRGASPGSGFNAEYSHEELEAWRVYWHPDWGMGRSNHVRSRVWRLIAYRDCSPAVVVTRNRGVFLSVGKTVDPTWINHGAGVFPIHWSCEGTMEP